LAPMLAKVWEKTRIHGGNPPV